LVGEIIIFIKSPHIYYIVCYNNIKLGVIILNFFYFLDRYLDKLNDFKFQSKWKKYFHDNLNRTVWSLFFIWFLVVICFGWLFTQVVGTFFGIVLTIFFSGYFAYIVIFQFLRFLAKNNARYVQGEIFSKNNTMNYEDVVETIKK